MCNTWCIVLTDGTVKLFPHSVFPCKCFGVRLVERSTVDVPPSMAELVPGHNFAGKGIHPPTRILILTPKPASTKDGVRIKDSVGYIRLGWINEDPNILVSNFALFVGDGSAL